MKVNHFTWCLHRINSQQQLTIPIMIAMIPTPCADTARGHSVQSSNSVPPQASAKVKRIKCNQRPN